MAGGSRGGGGDKETMVASLRGEGARGVVLQDESRGRRGGGGAHRRRGRVLISMRVQCDRYSSMHAWHLLQSTSSDK